MQRRVNFRSVPIFNSAVAIALILLALTGCAKQVYQVSFSAVIGEDKSLPFAGPAGSVDCVLIHTQQQTNDCIRVLESLRFWEQSVMPRIASQKRQTPAAQNPIKVTSARQRSAGKKIFGDFTIEITHGNETVFSAVADALGDHLRQQSKSALPDIGTVSRSK